ncbi:phytochelatin synthase family protein [Histidinibacterium lentulum]|uniref:glutathione gamma-glutamylcysteinyltransferase n=1 Tax=Histidinibacterium lentulum TaxID=2480588 RepID=A0A3N2RA63_9RHOB|nr:phytochelatin synthase family protein [Histidinibacterium lentulum]ROU04297.1 hypothetical protein EAT49_02595 [Histidinibacterium lentulum]
MRVVPLVSLMAVLALPASAEDAEDYPKLGPNAVSITEATEYLRAAAAPDYWAFSSFVKPQFTTSACGIASVTAALNGLRGLPGMASETVLSQPELLDLVGSETWTAISAEGGDGVTFAQLEEFTAASLAATGMTGFAATGWQPAAEDDATLADLRARLAANEASAEDALLVYYNQGVVTGDWDGPHVALIGAYDPGEDRVLILEVDQQWYIPYWTPVPILLEAMLKPTGAEHGVLEGETGGFVAIAPAT